MFNFFRGVLSHIAEVPIKNEQISFATDTESLHIDSSSQRYTVKDPTAGKALELDSDNKLIKLKNASSQTISTIDLSDLIQEGFQLCKFEIGSNGHLYYTADTGEDITSENFELDQTTGHLYYIT